MPGRRNIRPGFRLVFWREVGWLLRRSALPSFAALATVLGIALVVEKGQPGESYNIGGGLELNNRELTERVLEAMGATWDSVQPVEDRKGHDRRYSITHDKVTALGWRTEHTLEDGLAATVEWYRANRDWWEPLIGPGRALDTDGIHDLLLFNLDHPRWDDVAARWGGSASPVPLLGTMPARLSCHDDRAMTRLPPPNMAFSRRVAPTALGVDRRASRPRRSATGPRQFE